MKPLKFPLLLAATLSVGLNGCFEKDVESPEQNKQACIINKIISKDDGSYSKIEYDDKQRIGKIFFSDDQGEDVLLESFLYSPDKITTIDYSEERKNYPNQTNDTTVYIIANSKVISSRSVYHYSQNNTPQYKVTSVSNKTYEYNTEGYLTKVNEISSTTSTEPGTTPISYTGNIVYTYKDGNVVSKSEDNGEVTETYEYYPGKPALFANLETNLLDYFINPHANNLLKRITMTDYTGISTFDYTYIYNAEELPVTVGVTARYPNSGNTPEFDINDIEYKCGN